MQKNIIILFCFLSLYSLTPIIFNKTIYSAYFYFEPVSNKIGINQQIDIVIKIDTEDQAPVTADAVILFDSNNLTLVDAVEPTSGDKFFPRMVKKISSNKAIIGGTIEPETSPKSGSGIFAILKFKSKTESYNLVTLSCSQGLKTDSNINLKVEDKVTDVIDCNKINQSRIAVETQAQTTPSYPGGPSPIINSTIAPTARVSTVPTTRPILSPIPTRTPTPTLTPTINLTLTPTATGSATISATIIYVTATQIPSPSELIKGGLFDQTMTAATIGLVLIGLSMLIRVFVKI